MDYPENFNTPAFPAGKSIAVSRFMAIGSLVTFFLVICMCGLMIWAVKSRRVDPFIISMDSLTGEWRIVGRPFAVRNYSPARAMQESVVANFVQNWFSISDNMDDNNLMWRNCERASCTGAEALSYSQKTCALSCAASADIYMRFVSDVMPDFQARAGYGEKWTVNRDTMSVTPVGTISDAGGAWRVLATVHSNMADVFQVLAFVKVVQNMEYYPMTMGYYVADFSTYRID